MTLTELFSHSFHRRRDELALEFRDQRLTFGDLDTRSNRLARLLAIRGLCTGDRLCAYLGNSVQLIDLFLACAKLGVIFVPINILYKDREIAHIIGDAEPRAVVTDAAELPGTATVWHAADLAHSASPHDATEPEVTLDGAAPAALIYTSGTTGASKGAILTHTNFSANARTLLDSWRITSSDRLLLALPLFHVHGLGNGLHTWLAAGCRMRLLERFERQTAIDQFLDFRPTLFFGVPAMYVRLLESPAGLAREIGGFMRLFVSGSAPLPAQVLEDFRRLFGHVILERYGMTETLMNISNPYAGERRAGTVGLALPGVSVRLLDAAEKPVPDGETGEVYVRGPNVFAGYWRRPEATRDAFKDGYFRTGDLAVRSPDGYYTLKGRSGDLIISGGFNIYPREIEEFLEELAPVAEAAVIGVPDKVRGEVPVAYVVARGKLDVAALEAACRASLASFKIPRAFIVVDKLPRTALGKVQKHLLPPQNAGG